jgi:predicted site-specific integrase-resolvase
MPGKLMTSGEVGHELGLSPRTISRYARQGLITAEIVTAGGQYRFDLPTVRTELLQLARQRQAERERRQQLRKQQQRDQPPPAPGA